MDTDRMKKTMEWFYSTVYRVEPVQRQPSAEPVPSPIRTARSLETGNRYRQSEVSTFIKQAKLLANYEDDYEYDKPVTRYFPTYQSLTDPQLRGYFSWRTKLRKGEIQKTSLSFAFLYLYELLNQIGIADPMDGFRKLKDFQAAYGQLDSQILPYLEQWLMDYVIYYGLDPALLADTPQVSFDKNLAVLAKLQDYDGRQIMEALTVLSTYRLDRSKFYKARRQAMDTVIPSVLRRVSEHYASRCKKTMVEQYFGPYGEFTTLLFASAVFQRKIRSCQFTVDEVRTYFCRDGSWSVQKYDCLERPSPKLGALIKTIDSVMRDCCAYRYPIKRELDTKWVIKLIEEEANAFLAAEQAARAKKVTIDYSQLARIRRDAADTRDKLIVEEEAMEPESPAEPAQAAPEAEAGESLLSKAEYRLLQCLLYGRDYGWVQASGQMLSVLVDSINEKLFDEFSDSVLILEDPPALIEDYIEDLKGMVRP